MFKELKEQDKASHLTKIAGEFEEGIKLYKAFSEALKTQDKVRSPRLAVKLDSWHSKLTLAQKQDFAALLVKQGLITGALAAAIKTFNASFTKFS